MTRNANRRPEATVTGCTATQELQQRSSTVT